MAINDKTCVSLDRRNSNGNYHGVERRRGHSQGSFIMMTVSRWTFYGLLVFSIILGSTVLNLQFFAKQGARYTAADGAHERAERIQGDTDLRARIDALQAAEHRK